LEGAGGGIIEVGASDIAEDITIHRATGVIFTLTCMEDEIAKIAKILTSHYYLFNFSWKMMQIVMKRH
jgi:hypothetical protein